MPYEQNLRQLNLFSLERRRLRTDLILTFKLFKGEVNLNPSDFFLHPSRAGLRRHNYRLLQGPSRLRRRSGAFSVRAVKYWARLPTLLAVSPSVSIFKKTVGPSIFRNLLILFPFHGIFLYIVTPGYLCFPNPKILICLCGYYWPSWPVLPLIKKIK